MKASYPEQEPNVEALIVENMNLVKKIAWHMHGRVRSAIEIEDLMQIGYFGLVTAAQKYSPKEGATFASYAVLRIRGAIVDHLRKSSNLCRTTIQMQQKQKKVVESLVSSLQRVARFIDAEQIDAAPIIDYGELNQEPSEFKDLVEEHTTSEDF